MAIGTFDAIRQTVRRITRTPSTSQLSDSQLNDYINTFLLYDFPEHLRLFNLRTTLTFYTQPNVDVYQTNTTDVNDALYNFKNKYIAVHPPLFLAGIQGFYTQWRDVFYGYYPQTNTISDTLLRGNGTTGAFSGVVTAHPMIQSNVIFTCLDEDGQGMILIDYPVSNTMGALGLVNQPATIPSAYGDINYITGAFNLNFPDNTQINAPIYVENIGYQPGKPLAVLYYNDQFTIRPVPDKVYPIQIEVDIRPDALSEQNTIPQLEQWCDFIALGTARKVFRDRMDMDSINLIDPEYNLQMRLCLRTTLTQQANERTVTIYTQGKTYGFGGWGASGWPY